MESILTEYVQNSLRQFMYGNALFMCERLCAEFPSESNSQLLATCYLHNNQSYAAYHILKGSEMAQSRYLFALSCFRMDLLQEAEKALCNNNNVNEEVPNGAAGHYLLGLIYKYTDRNVKAVNQFEKALKLDPLMWAAYEELCKLGAADEADKVFGDSAYSICVQTQTQNRGGVVECDGDSVVGGGLNRGSVLEDMGSRKRDVSENHHDLLHRGNGGSTSSHHHHGSNGVPFSFYSTPSPMAAQSSGVGPPPVHRNVQINPCTFSTDSSAVRTVVNTVAAQVAPRRKFVDEGKLRKVSGRLFSDSGPRRSTRLAGESMASATASNSFGGPNSSSVNNGTNNNNHHHAKYLGSSRLNSVSSCSVTLRKGQSWVVNESSDDGVSRNDVYENDAYHSNDSCPSPRNFEQETGILDVLTLLKILGEGFRLSCLYKCRDALDVYMKLPLKHYNTGWVLAQVGKAYFEMVDYFEADHAFTQARSVRPYSLEGMDVYSTVLYHLKEDMKLSYLALELISTDRLAPQSWCAMGNCYSIQKDHETALKNFQRAVQLDSRFAYAHTLCGHEYVALEDFESGIRSYQNALRGDARHYNAWYGLGMVYFRQEKFELSEHHFRMAYQINPGSSVIMSYLGSNLHQLDRNTEALDMMEKANRADKKNPLPLYQKANILVSMENFDKALEVLEELKEYVPRESSVYALMGRIYKRRHMYDKAMLHFGLALDLKPSTTDVAAIKSAIEKLHLPDDMEDSL